MTSHERGAPSNPPPVSPEGLEDIKTRIFVDADMLIGQSKAEKEWQQLILFSLSFFRRRVELLTTEITRIQVAKHRAEQACKKLQMLSSEKNAELARELYSVEVPTINKRDMYERAYDHYLKKVTDETSNWRCVEYRDGIVPKVFTEYGKKRGFFREQAKKNQFADAVIFEMLRAEATHDTPVIIFARDKDFSAVDEYDDNIKHVKSWSALIDVLGIREEIPQSEDVVKKHQDLVAEQVCNYIIESLDEAIERRGQIQEECPDIRVRRIEARPTGGMIFDKRSTDGELIWEQFMIIGEMKVFFDLLNVPVFMTSHLSMVDSDIVNEPTERADARCDVVVTFIGRRARSQNSVDLLEIEFTDGGCQFCIVHDKND